MKLKMTTYLSLKFNESFFQTLLGNSPYKARIQRNLTYIDWSGGGASPAYITEKHLEFFEATQSITLEEIYGAGEILFARKFSDEAVNIVIKQKYYDHEFVFGPSALNLVI